MGYDAQDMISGVLPLRSAIGGSSVQGEPGDEKDEPRNTYRSRFPIRVSGW
jgi:hypothetical protein